jgi:hypothetical protein
VTMWHTHQFGGYNSAQGVGLNVGSGSGSFVDPAFFMCDGSVVSFAPVPNPFTGVNDIWMCVKRTINGNSQWQIEKMVGKNTVRTSAYQGIWPGGQGSEPCYVDAATLQVDNGSPTDFTYFQGVQFQGYALTGTYYSATWGIFALSTSAVDSSGNCVLNQPLPPDYGSLTPAHTFVLGLPYTSIIQPVRPDLPSQIGTGQDAIKRTAKIYIRMYKSLLGNAGSPPGRSSGLSQIPWAIPASMGQSPEIYTGDKDVFIASQYDRSGYVYIQQANPFPFTVVSYTIEGASYDQ